MAPERKGIQIERCYRLAEALLSGKHLDRQAIAQMLGVQVAAADVHIKALLAAKVPGVSVERKGNKKVLYWRSDGLTTSATRSSAVAACFGSSVAQLFRGTSYATLLEQARESVIGRLKKRGDFEDARRKFLFISQAGEVALPDRQGLLDDLVDAVLRQQMVELEYTSFDGEARKEKITPWSIAIYDHQLYILAGESDDTPRPYRLSRIRSHRVLAKTFKYPDRTTYDPEHLFRDSFGIFIRGEGEVEEVRLRFAPRWRTYARTHFWHSTHQVASDDDDGIVVRMRVRICRELEAFVLGFGGEVEVLAPAALRSKIAERAAELAAVYAQSSGATRTAPGRQIRKNHSAKAASATRSRTLAAPKRAAQSARAR